MKKTSDVSSCGTDFDPSKIGVQPRFCFDWLEVDMSKLGFGLLRPTQVIKFIKKPINKKQRETVAAAVVVGCLAPAFVNQA